MLTLLKIRNLALVDELVWDLGPGLISVTGETAAGKSVIVGALKLVLGGRAEKTLIRTGEETCAVEAVFELKDAAEPAYFNGQPTSFVLPPEAVDRLRAAAGTIITDSPEFKRLLNDVKAQMVAAPAQADAPPAATPEH